MFIRSTTIYILITVMGLFALFSCVSGTKAPKGNHLEKEDYLSQNFSTDAIPQQVMDTLKTGEFKSGNYNQIKISYDVVFQQNGQAPVTRQIQVTNINAGSGIIKQIRELSGNGIPFLLHYNISYMDIIPLKWQKVSLSRNKAGTVHLLQDLIEFTAIPASPAPDTKFIYEYTFSTPSATDAPARTALKFTVKKSVQASSIHPSLKGDAVILEGKFLKTNIVRETKTVYFLTDYGMILEKEIRGPRAKMTYRITQISID